MSGINGQNQFGQNQFGQNQFGQNQFGQNQFGQNQFGQNQFGQNQFGQNQFGQNQFDPQLNNLRGFQNQQQPNPSQPGQLPSNTFNNQPTFSPQGTISQVNYGQQMTQISIDFSTQTSTANIPDNLKVQFQKAPYLYYMYFYSLIYYKYATAETKVQGVMIKDYLLYIAQTLLNIVPSLGDQAGNTLIAGQGSPTTATFNIQAQVQSANGFGAPVGSSITRL